MANFLKVIKDTPYYTIGDLIHRSSAFLLLPFYTYYLTPEEFGIATLYLVIASFISGFVSLNIHTSLIRFIRNDHQDSLAVTEVTSIAIVILISGTLIFNAIFLSLVLILKNFLIILDQNIMLVIYCILIASLISSYEIFQRVLIANQKPKTYIINQLSNFIIYTLVTFFFLENNYSYYSLFLGSLISYTLFYLRLLVFFFKNFKFIFNKSKFIEMINYSIRLIPNRVMGLAPMTFDRIILATISEALISIYSVGFRVGESITYITDGFFKAYQVWMYDALLDYNNKKKTISFLSLIITVFNSLLAILLVINAKMIISVILHPSYIESFKIVFFASFFVLIRNINNMNLHYIRFTIPKIYLVNVSTFVFVFTCFIMMLILKENYGIYGVAFALVASKFISLFFTNIVVFKILNFKDNFLFINQFLILVSIAIAYFINSLNLNIVSILFVDCLIVIILLKILIVIKNKFSM